MNEAKDSRQTPLGPLMGFLLRLFKWLHILRDALGALDVVLAGVLVVDREIALDALCKPLRHLCELLAESADGLGVHVGVRDQVWHCNCGIC